MDRETGLIIVPHPVSGIFSDFEYQRRDKPHFHAPVSPGQIAHGI
jgi:hypothetical protein